MCIPPLAGEARRGMGKIPINLSKFSTPSHSPYPGGEYTLIFLKNSQTFGRFRGDYKIIRLKSHQFGNYP